MWFLRPAKSRHKLFRAQFLFGTKIKTTYQNTLPNTWILDLSVKRGSQRPVSVLGPRQKRVDLPPTFFQLFINFLVDFHLLCRIPKNLESRFSVSVNYHRFWLLTWSKMKNFDFFYKMPFNFFSKRIILAFMFYVKKFYFWPCQKSKCVIICWNWKTGFQIFWNPAK